jgi:hypothetical protein
MTRKSQTGPVSEDGDPSARLEWKPATKSALKKATGLYDQHKRKRAMVAELAVREKEEALRRQKVLEEAKKVVITRRCLASKTGKDSVRRDRPKESQTKRWRHTWHTS